ncbi:DUF1194 domain-containing protein [Maliponia aquimaris]|uniref:DUF1194 domain-containing protein n=1 Tax=Maliponia aquimaris TaxID=1673631 RepID=UPI001594FEA3|nr:DUF1194 domain-containing protein [Maliponia aquimaris]
MSALALSGVLATATPSNAVTVDLELLLMNDVSGSITAADFNFQLQGIAAAFRDAAVLQKIQNGAIGQIAVSVAFFADSIVQSIPWTLISDSATAEAFAVAVENAIRPAVGSSDNTSVALLAAEGFFIGNGYEGTRNVIDIVTEGAQDVSGCSFNQPVCAPLQQARDTVLAGEIDTINALLLDDRNFFGNDPADIIQAVPYAQTNMIGGPGAFADFEEDFTGFAAAINAKLLREIDPPPIPLPGAAFLLLGALGALAAAGKRRKAA